MFEGFFSDPKKNLVYFFLLMVMAFCGLTLSILLNLPDIESLESYSPSQTTTFYDLNGHEIGRVHQEENRVVVPLSKISPWLTKSVIAVEDERFYSHRGIDLVGIGRAFFANLLEGGRISQGGSTITQQTARSIFLSRERTLTRKIAEIILALQMEQRFNKDEILEKYLNNVYWGHNAYGAEAAARIYFGKSASQLDLSEASLMAGIIEGPELFSPYRHPKMSRARQRVVLNRLLSNHLINPVQARAALSQKFEFPKERLIRFSRLGPYFKSYVMTKLRENYTEDQIYNGGIKVYTTMDPRMQLAAETIITDFVTREGIKYHFSQAVLVAIDPRSGYIKALVGGADFGKTQFNRVIQAKRQPGSSFKPFIYTAGLMDHFSPDDIMDDEEISFNVPRTLWNPTGKWEPKNFSKEYMGRVTLRTAIALSLNIPTIKLLEAVGVQKVIDLAHKMGIKSELQPNLALALGVSEVTPLEITSAFGVLANGGIRVEPTAITKLEDHNGNLLYKNDIKEERIIDENISAVMVEMMKGVLARGTGFRGKINRPSAAKTGTTENFKDAWFIGFTPQLVVGVWVGNDDNKPMKGIAEVAVCPRIWKAFMEQALVDQPILNFPAPKGLSTVKLCLDSGLQAGPYCPPERVFNALLWRDKIPAETCNVHTSPNAEEPTKQREDTTDGN